MTEHASSRIRVMPPFVLNGRVLHAGSRWQLCRRTQVRQRSVALLPGRYNMLTAVRPRGKLSNFARSVVQRHDPVQHPLRADNSDRRGGTRSSQGR